MLKNYLLLLTRLDGSKACFQASPNRTAHHNPGIRFTQSLNKDLKAQFLSMLVKQSEGAERDMTAVIL